MSRARAGAPLAQRTRRARVTGRSPARGQGACSSRPPDPASSRPRSLASQPRRRHTPREAEERPHATPPEGRDGHGCDPPRLRRGGRRRTPRLPSRARERLPPGLRAEADPDRARGGHSTHARPQRRSRSGGEAPPALTAAAGQDRSPGTRAHPGSESVRLRATAPVGLEGPLGHLDGLATARPARTAGRWRVYGRSRLQDKGRRRPLRGLVGRPSSRRDDARLERPSKPPFSLPGSKTPVL
jgi:hypothetical protein